MTTTTTKPDIMSAIAAVDEQLTTEEARVENARAELADASAKIAALVDTRGHLAALTELYGIEPPPPCPIPQLHTASGNGNGNGNGRTAAVTRPRRPRGSITDAAVLDALRSLGGRGTVAETAGAMECNIEAARRRLNALVEAGALDVSGAGNAGDPSRYTIKSPTAPEPAPEPERGLEAGESTALDEAIRRVTTPGAAAAAREAVGAADTVRPVEAAAREAVDAEKPVEVAALEAAGVEPEPVPRRASANLSRLPRREAPPVSARTRRALAAKPAAPKQPATLREQLLAILHDGAPDARWKVPELIRELGRRFRAPASTETVGHELGALLREGRVRKQADWFALPEAA